MRKILKKIVAVASALAMVVAGISYSPAKVSADDTWSIGDVEFVTYTVNGSSVYGIKNLSFTAYQGSANNDYAYAGYVDSISNDNLVRNYSADWLWGIQVGGNGLNYDGVVTNNAKTIYFEAGSTHTFIIAAYAADDTTGTTVLDTVSKTVTFPSEEATTSEEDGIKAHLVSSDNLAIGKTAFASSQASDGYQASYAIDDNMGTRWAAGSYNAGEYVGVDLGAVYTISSVELCWEGAYATDYDIQVSTDGTTYTTVQNVTPTSAETKAFAISNVNAQFVRIYCNTNALPYGYSIWGLGVYGTYSGEGVTTTPEETTTIAEGTELIPAASQNSGSVSAPATTGGEPYANEYKIQNLSLIADKYYVATYKVTSSVDKWFQLRLQESGSWADVTGQNYAFVNTQVAAGDTVLVKYVFKSVYTGTNGVFDICYGYLNAAAEAGTVIFSDVSLTQYNSEAAAQAYADTLVLDDTESTTEAVETSTDAEESTTEATATAPAAPVGLVANINDLKTNYTIAFAPVEDATSYNLYVDGALYGAIANGGVVTIADLGFEAGSTHSVQVTAVNAAGESELSTAYSITVPSDETEETSTGSSEYTWVEIGGGAAATYYYNSNTTASIVNVQQPGFASETGVYITVPAGISAVTVNGASTDVAAIQGAGTVVYLSSLTQNINTVVITYAGGELTVLIKNASVAGDDEETTSAEEVTSAEEESTSAAEYTWVEIGGGDAATYYYNSNTTVSIVNIQQPGFASETGVYVTVPAGISAVTVNGASTDVAAIQGAGTVVYLSALTQNINTVVITYAGGEATVLIKNASAAAATDVVTDDLAITGYQINVSGIEVNGTQYEGGLRTVYEIPETVEGNSTEGCEFGLIYALAGKVEVDNVTLDNLGTYVVKSAATSAGLVGTDATSGNAMYATTFVTNYTTVSKAHLSRIYYVRSYVIIDGVTYYSAVKQMSAYKVAKSVYNGQTAGSATAHEYLYDNILSKIDSSFEEIEYTGSAN